MTTVLEGPAREEAELPAAWIENALFFAEAKQMHRRRWLWGGVLAIIIVLALGTIGLVVAPGSSGRGNGMMTGTLDYASAIAIPEPGTVTAYASGGAVYRAEASTTGHFQLNVPSGTYRVFGRLPGVAVHYENGVVTAATCQGGPARRLPDYRPRPVVVAKNSTVAVIISCGL